jgi:hypothetical protein
MERTSGVSFRIDFILGWQPARVNDGNIRAAQNLGYHFTSGLAYDPRQSPNLTND